jgi:hypothetical protein
MGVALDKKEAMRSFVKRNSSLFKQDPFPWEVLKRLKHAFFIEQIKSPVPKDAELAADIVEGMIVSSQINRKEDLDKLLTLPFFSEKVLSKEYYYEKLELKSKQTTPLLDVEIIKKAEISEKIRNELKAEVKKELIEAKVTEFQEWDEKISEKAEEYHSLPSILDGKDYPLPDYKELEKPVDNLFVAWWDKLGLKEDPFRELEGLSRIDESLYSKIIEKTSIFIKYDSMIKSSFGELFKRTVIYGEYGSGKTTFFDYMRSVLNDYKVRPIYVQLGGEFEVRELIFEFDRQVSLELKKLHAIFAEENAPPIDTLDDEQAIIELMKKLAYRGAKGFVIFVDDLHKGDLDKAMRFMSHLQVLTSRFRRATDLNIGFFVAGYLDWEDKINGSEKFSGSIDRQEQMPPLEIEVALDAINKRLKAFAKNPENPRQVEKSLIEKIYKALQYNSQKITFRRVMRELVTEFESGHFDALNANPIRLSQATLRAIRISFENNQIAKKQLDSILFNPSLSPSQKRFCFELMIRIYLSNGLSEADIKEVEVPFLQQLKHSGIISKVSGNGLVWKISGDLYSANKKIIGAYGLSVEDYLLKLYSEHLPEPAKTPKPQNEEINQIENLLTYLVQSDAGKYLSEAKVLHLKILESKEKNLNSAEFPDTIGEDCTKALARLTMAYMAYEKMKIIRRTNFERILFWKDFWWSPEAVLQFCRAITSGIESKQRIPLVLALYREAFPQIVNFFKNEYENSELFYIPLSNLKNEEIKLLHECRHLWNNHRFKEMTDILVNAVDRKLKIFLFNMFTILYGDYENRIKLLDRESRDNICEKVQGEGGLSFSLTRNEFQRLNRFNFKNIMTGIDGSIEGRRNWKCIFSSVFVTWSERTLHDYLITISSINANLTHSLDDSSTIEEKNYVCNFMKQSTTFIRSINRMYSKIITDDYFKQVADQVTFSLCPSIRDDFTQPIKITQDDIKRVEDVFESKNRIRGNFDDQEYMEGFFGLNYRKIYASLALIYRGLSHKGEGVNYRLQMLASKGPEIRMALYRTTMLSTTSNSGSLKKEGIPLSNEGTRLPIQTEEHAERSQQYDVFICHATEDKEPFVSDLANLLSKNLRVWYDDFSLSLGDSLRRKIDMGITNSRYGVVVLSENFFKKDWPQKELDGLATKERNFDKVILPVWHGVNRERVQLFSPTLADRVAVSSDKGTNHVVKEILKAVNSKPLT